MNETKSKWQHALLIGGVLLIAMNLRPAITGIGPLAERLNADGLSRVTIGSLTTIPLILFGAVGLWTGWLGTRIGFARALGFGLLLLGIGCLMRSIPGDFAAVWRISGTILIGSGIAIGNVLLPGLVKSRYPAHIGLLTSLYATAMNLGAAGGIAFAVPLANSFGWRGSLATWGVVAFFMLLLWIPQMIPDPKTRSSGHPLKGVMAIARKGRAWPVMVFMGLQSTVFYCTVAWMPTVLQSRGMSEETAAGWVTAMQLLGCFFSLIIPTLAGRARSQSGWVLFCASSNVLGILGILLLPTGFMGISILLLGLGMNSGFGLALLLLAMRSRTPATAASLSSFSQAGGYLLSAPGPWLVGLLSTTAGGWPLAFGLVAFLAAVSACAGYFAGREGEMDIDVPG